MAAVSCIDPLPDLGVVARLELESVGDIFLAHYDGAADHVRSSFLGDVSEGGEPGLSVVPGRSEVDLHTPGIELGRFVFDWSVS